ncbi:Tri17 [Stachybotrys chartarum IBT 7711]|uniref:Tri17 n=1 Tax=Stachybotrys chartarum (strain CBS 109288 / IBT 7711) TaxID=1280523 RepID=A0A084AFG1_STACB|nr:Tri17 [Stachybotrys chartarum IBT 7711]
MSEADPVPLAIVGIGCRFSGYATNPGRLWDLLMSGKSTWSKVPADRWNEEAFRHHSPDGINNHQGGHFLDQDIDRFDAELFGITPEEAASIDPQQRLLLETTYEALENAGIRQDTINGSQTAVYTALSARDYDHNVDTGATSVANPCVRSPRQDVPANRISRLFNLIGPSVNMDSGSDGGMAAITHACQALRLGRSDVALAGASNLILNPDQVDGIDDAHGVRVDGRVPLSSSEGSTHSRGEGVAALVIKRLDDAIRDQNPIRAILRDANIGQNSHALGSGEDSRRIEICSNGTPGKGGAEPRNLQSAFSQHQDIKSSSFTDQIKSTIGDTGCVSALAAVIASVMFLENTTISPDATQNDVAGVVVNAFSSYGTKSHVVLERTTRPVTTSSGEEESSSRLFVFSASSQTSLVRMLAVHADWTRKHGGNASTLRDLSYTMSQRRSLLPWRFSCIAESQAELLEALASGSKKTDSLVRITPGAKISFIFTGQGSQWAEMGRELLLYPAFHDSFQRSREILQDLGCSWDLVEETLKTSAESRLHEAELAQPATTAIQIALVDLATQWGVVPDSVIGHSSGEVAAAYAAGYLSQHQAIKVAYVQGFASRIAEERFGKGSMLAVGVGEYEVEPYMDLLSHEGAVIACQNSPNSTTIAGDDAAITELSELLSRESIFNRKLNVDTAYHSHHMQTAASMMQSALKDIISAPSTNNGIELFSTVTGSVKSDAFGADYWIANLINKVRFCDGLQALCESKRPSPLCGPESQRIFIELGPHSALAGPIRQCMTDMITPISYCYTSALIRGTGASRSTLIMAGQVFNQGYPLNLAAVFASYETIGYTSVISNLPPYPWDHTRRHWNESRASRDHRFRKHPYHDLLGLRMTDNSSLHPLWRHRVSLGNLPWLGDHIVNHLVLFPCSGYLAMAVEACSQLIGDYYPGKNVEKFFLKDVSFLKELVIPEDHNSIEIQLCLTSVAHFSSEASHSSTRYGFSITAYTTDEQWNEYCHGTIACEFAAGQPLLVADVTQAHLMHQLDSASGNLIQARDFYEELGRLGTVYGSTFKGIEEMTVDGDSAASCIVIPDVVTTMPCRHLSPHIIHPTTLDILLHTSIPLVHQKLGVGPVTLAHIENMIITAAIDNTPGDAFRTVTNLVSIHSNAAVAELFVFSEKAGATDAPVLYASGIELRSSSPDMDDTNTPDGLPDICYEMKWVLDERFISAKQLQSLRPFSVSEDGLTGCCAFLAEYVKHKANKQSDLAVIELAGPDAASSATVAFLEALRSSEARPTVYDFASSSGNFDGIQNALHDQDMSVFNFRELDIGADHLDPSFNEHYYNIVLASNILRETSNIRSILTNARRLLKPDGVLLLVEDATSGQDSLSIEECADLMLDASFKMQLASPDNQKRPRCTFFIARALTKAPVLIPKIILVSQDSSRHENFKHFATEMSNTLGSNVTQVVKESWHDMQPHDANAIYVVIDDGAQPLLANVSQNRFRHVVDLLQKPAKVIWLCVQHSEKSSFNPKKHFINGVSRTAHAENRDLDMVTIDVQQTLDQKTEHAILQLLSNIVDSFGKKDILREREYVFKGEDVLVPRLLPHATLNHQISGKLETTIQTIPFSKSPVSLRMIDDKKGFVFVENASHGQPLLDNFVEIESKAFGIPASYTRSAQSGYFFNEYAGVVAAVGCQVLGPKIGDRVVTISTDSCANRLRVPAGHVQAIPRHLSFTDAAALPLAFMAAIHALVDVANIQAKQVLLVDNATSEYGQAALIVARNLEATVIAAVARVDEAAFLQNVFEIQPSHIVARDSYLSHRQMQRILGLGGGIDVILGCGSTPVTTAISRMLKPFGTVVNIQPRGGTSGHHYGATFCSNATVATFDIDSLLQARPHKLPVLLEQVVKMVDQGLLLPPRSTVVLALNNKLEKELNLTQKHGNLVKHIIEVQEHSTVKVEKPSYQVPDLATDATYVVAGGLNDLSQRFLLWMAHAGARYLVTLSSSEEASETFLEFRKKFKDGNSHCSLMTVNCDVSKVHSITAALSEIRGHGFPSVKGVILLNTARNDSALAAMTADTFNAVTNAKVAGVLNLHTVFGREDLDFFISMSSVTNIIGAEGQAIGNAGDAYQEALAHFDGDTGCFNMVLNIGGFEGAAPDNGPSIQASPREGFSHISDQELTAYLDYALSANARTTRCHQSVIGLMPDIIARTIASNGAARTSMFTHVRRNAGALMDENDSAARERRFEHMVQEGASKEEISAFVARSIGNKVAEFAAIDPMEVKFGSSILDYGLDSLMAIELRNWMAREFDAPIQLPEVVDSPDIWTLSERVVNCSQLTTSRSDTSKSSVVSGSEQDPLSTLPTSRANTPEVKE